MTVGIFISFLSINALSGCASYETWRQEHNQWLADLTKHDDSNEAYKRNREIYYEVNQTLMDTAVPGFGYVFGGFDYLSCQLEPYTVQYRHAHPEHKSEKLETTDASTCELRSVQLFDPNTSSEQFNSKKTPYQSREPAGN